MTDISPTPPVPVPTQEISRVMGVAAPLVSVVVTIGFIGILALWMFHAPNPNDQVLSLLVGTLAAAFTQVVNYWLGSSIGSASKDTTISRIAAVVPKVVTDKVNGKSVGSE
jgi:hypothetical protein